MYLHAPFFFARLWFARFFPPLFFEIVIKLNKEEGLVTNSCEKIIVSNEIKYIWPSAAEEIWKCEGWLPTQYIPNTVGKSDVGHKYTLMLRKLKSNAQFGDAVHQNR